MDNLTLFDGRACTKCKKWYSFSQFNKSRSGTDGHVSECKGCRAIANRNWRLANLERERSKARIKGAINAKKYSEYKKNNRDKYNQARRESYRKNPESFRLRNLKWRRSHRGHVATQRARRSALRNNAEGSFTIQEWINLCSKYGNICLRCREVKRLCPDHVIPLYYGGSNFIHNIQPLCKACNSSKGIKDTDYRCEHDLIANIEGIQCQPVS